MKNYDLQMFADDGSVVAGSRVVYLYRVKKNAATVDGTTLAFTTENGRTKSKDADNLVTKDGSIRNPGQVEQEITATTLLKKGDTMIETIEQAFDDNELMEIWEANLEEAGTGTNKFKGRYFQGYITEFEKTSNAEDNVEISLTFSINGNGATGDVTVTDSQQQDASYVFTDSVKTGA